MQLWPRQQQAAARRNLLRAERSQGIRQHEQHCGGESDQSFHIVFHNLELSYKKHLSPSLPARPGTVRWRTWQLIVPSTVMSTSLGESDHISKVNNELYQVRDLDGHDRALHTGGLGRVEPSGVWKARQIRGLQLLGGKHVRVLHVQTGESTFFRNPSQE